MQNLNGNRVEITKKGKVLNLDDDDDYENVSVEVPSVPTRERRGIAPGVRSNDLALKCMDLPVKGTHSPTTPNQAAWKTQDVPRFQPPSIGLHMSSSAVNTAFSDVTDTLGSGKQNAQGRLIVILVVLMSLMFVLWIIVTTLVFTYYSSITGGMSEIKQSVSQVQETAEKEKDNLRGEIIFINRTLVMERDKLMAEIRTINKTIGRLSSPCPPNWKLVGFSCYYISGDPKTWEEAENDCIRRSSTLLVLTSSKELIDLKPLLGNKRFWFGLRKVANVWKWLDGTVVTFKQWSPNEPNNADSKEHCAETISGSWNDLDCNRKINHICKAIGK
ncbi:C-type lectin domain family 10 member A-like isoform X2 [Ascaphus truei]|uniref:C-type lectin domain family 10 member A-like isoform X2 n=1 Tax=Ascaphus truei TaxID=8439 RepID=UPI003F59B17D